LTRDNTTILTGKITLSLSTHLVYWNSRPRSVKTMTPKSPAFPHTTNHLSVSKSTTLRKVRLPTSLSLSLCVYKPHEGNQNKDLKRDI